MNIPDRFEGLVRFCNLLFPLLVVLGAALYYFFKTDLLGGFGIATALLSIASIFHFKNVTKQKVNNIETGLSWFLISASILGFFIIIINKWNVGPNFNYGVGAAMCLIAAVSYIIELLFNYLNSVK